MEKKIVLPQLNIKRSPPLNFSEENDFLFKREWDYSISETCLYSSNEIKIGHSFIFYVKNNPRNIFNTLTKNYFNRSLKHLIKNFFSDLFLSKKIEIGNDALWIIDKWSNGYFHWLTEVLPRLMIGKKYRAGKMLVVLPEEFKSIKFVKETLSMFNIESCYFKRSQILQIDNLILPVLGTKSGNFHPDLLIGVKKQIENCVIPKTQIFPGRRVYISRQKALRRRVTNPEAFESLLKRHGFEILYFEELSFAEQVMISSQAKILLSIHGAGLTNMLFMDSNTTVIELRRQGDTMNNCYFSMSNALNLNYLFFECAPEGELNSDLRVDCEKLDTMLSRYCSE